MATREINTSLTLTGEKEFNSQMKAVNSNLKTLKTEQAAIASSFDASSGAMSDYAKIIGNLKEQNKQQEEIIKKANVALKQNIAAYGEDSKQADHFRQIIAKAQTAINKNNAEIEKHNSALKKIETDQAAKKTEKLTAALKKIEKVGPKAQNAIKKIGDTSLKTVGSMAKLSAGAASVVAAITAAAGAAGIAAVSTMASYARESAEAAKELKSQWKPLNETQKKWLEYSKQLDSLDSAVAGAKSALAGVLLPVLSDLSGESAKFLNDFSAAMNGAAGDAKEQGRIIAEYIGKGAELIKQKLPEYKAVARELLAGLGEGLQEEGPELLDIAFDLVLDILDAIIDNAPMLADAGVVLIQKLMDGLIRRGPDVMTGAVNLVTQLVSGLAQAAPDLIPAAFDLVTQLVSALIQAAPDLLIAGLELVYGIISGLSEGLGNFAQSADEIVETLVQAFTDAWPKIKEIGSNIVSGIWEGISSSWEWLYEKIQQWVTDVVQTIKNFLGIASPSRVMRDEVGRFMAKGIGVGFEQEMAEVNREIQRSIQTSFDIPTPDAPAAPVGRWYRNEATGKVVNLTIYAQVLTQEFINSLVDTIDRELGDKV